MSDTSAPGAPCRLGLDWLTMLVSFPIDRLTANSDLERHIANWIWAAVPIQYCLFTRIAGGAAAGAWFSIAVSVLLCFVCMLVISALLAIVPVKNFGVDYGARVRAWTFSLAVTWTAASTLLALSYLLTALTSSGTNDIVQTLLCGSFLRCAEYPAELSFGTWLIYFVYSLLGVSAIIAIASAFGNVPPDSQGGRITAPLTIVVAAIAAVLLMLLYSSQTWT
ncbi:hypothetical protein JIR23_05545 [Bradyrhizobium diazoefficiens]|nr:hypothetical protein [Bradyrhizobium diazoefficiens]QQN65264.1 hypothetical protein JIR23_05545 [Bradyrhizobium diazoefficiens]